MNESGRRSMETAEWAAGLGTSLRWLRLSEQNFRVDKWNLCRG